MASRRPSLKSSSSDDGILSRISDYTIVRKGKSAACDAAYVAKRLMKSTGKAAWIVATTFIVLGLPLIIEMDREAQLNEAELQQASLLGGAAPSQPAFGPPKWYNPLNFLVISVSPLLVFGIVDAKLSWVVAIKYCLDTVSCYC